MFDPHTRLWTIHWMDSSSPRLTERVVGGFRDGVGEFHGEELLRGRPVPLRFLWTGITAGGAHWEQACFDARSGRWETNWTMDFRRADPVP